ncbi:hypothetical protein [Dongia sp.]|uniref:hypothetical protein n=1 Tax=Dongia sp. TaxID=1977262 RepID=UPI0035B30649
MNAFALFIIAALIMALPGSAMAQANTGPVAAPADLCQRYPGSLSAEELKQYVETCQKPAPETQRRPAAMPTPVLCNVAGIDDDALVREIQTACVGDLKDAFAFNAKMREHNVKLYRWQAEASDDMRVLVWVVVLAGIVMAIYQLAIIMLIELWRAKRKGPAEAPILGEQSLELGLGKVQITSSVTGVIVLALSIAFLYLYLTEVYPIKPPPG